MKAQEFSVILENRLSNTRQVLGTKALEYATADRLHNFKAAARVQGCTPAQALLGMMTKHLVSVVDIVRLDRDYSESTLDEKIGDTINYLILLEALLIEGLQEDADE